MTSGDAIAELKALIKVDPSISFTPVHCQCPAARGGEALCTLGCVMRYLGALVSMAKHDQQPELERRRQWGADYYAATIVQALKSRKSTPSFPS